MIAVYRQVNICMADTVPQQLIRLRVVVANIWGEMLMLYALVCKTIAPNQLLNPQVLRGFGEVSKAMGSIQS